MTTFNATHSCAVGVDVGFLDGLFVCFVVGAELGNAVVGGDVFPSNVGNNVGFFVVGLFVGDKEGINDGVCEGDELETWRLSTRLSM